MKVLLVSWEYPPVVVGGLGRHVHQLAEGLAGLGVDVTVLTRQPSGTDPASHPTTDTVVNGVRVIAVAEDPPEFDFGTDMMAWTLAMGHGLVREGLRQLRSGPDPWEPEVVHAHDWLVAHPAIALADFFDVPLIATLHATEAGRHSGWLAGHVNRQVHSVEWWLANTADALITCSTSMRTEVDELFSPGGGATPITVIHNGIDLTAWEYAERPPAHGPAELLFAGRLEYEKGVQDLLAALPEIRRSHPGTTLTIAGEGTQLDWLHELVSDYDLDDAVTFAGRQDHDGLSALMHRCAAIVLPSRYEPFGIVALEAAASGIPLVTSTAGGLGEAVDHGETGSTFPPADVAALTAAVRRTLNDPDAAAVRARRARAVLTEDFTWPVVAERTAAVYALATRREREPLARPHIPQRPLPHRDPNNPVD